MVRDQRRVRRGLGDSSVHHVLGAAKPSALSRRAREIRVDRFRGRRAPGGAGGSARKSASSSASHAGQGSGGGRFLISFALCARVIWVTLCATPTQPRPRLGSGRRSEEQQRPGPYAPRAPDAGWPAAAGPAVPGRSGRSGRVSTNDGRASNGGGRWDSPASRGCQRVRLAGQGGERGGRPGRLGAYSAGLGARP